MLSSHIFRGINPAELWEMIGVEIYFSHEPNKIKVLEKFLADAVSSENVYGFLADKSESKRESKLVLTQRQMLEVFSLLCKLIRKLNLPKPQKLLALILFTMCVQHDLVDAREILEMPLARSIAEELDGGGVHKTLAAYQNNQTPWPTLTSHQFILITLVVVLSSAAYAHHRDFSIQRYISGPFMIAGGLLMGLHILDNHSKEQNKRIPANPVAIVTAEQLCKLAEVLVPNVAGTSRALVTSAKQPRQASASPSRKLVVHEKKPKAVVPAPVSIGVPRRGLSALERQQVLHLHQPKMGQGNSLRIPSWVSAVGGWGVGVVKTIVGTPIGLVGSTVKGAANLVVVGFQNCGSRVRRQNKVELVVAAALIVPPSADVPAVDIVVPKPSGNGEDGAGQPASSNTQAGKSSVSPPVSVRKRRKQAGAETQSVAVGVPGPAVPASITAVEKPAESSVVPTHAPVSDAQAAQPDENFVVKQSRRKARKKQPADATAVTLNDKESQRESAVVVVAASTSTVNQPGQPNNSPASAATQTTSDDKEPQRESPVVVVAASTGTVNQPRHSDNSPASATTQTTSPEKASIGDTVVSGNDPSKSYVDMTARNAPAASISQQAVGMPQTSSSSVASTASVILGSSSAAASLQSPIGSSNERVVLAAWANPPSRPVAPPQHLRHPPRLRRANVQVVERERVVVITVKQKVPEIVYVPTPVFMTTSPGNQSFPLLGNDGTTYYVPTQVESNGQNSYLPNANGGYPYQYQYPTAGQQSASTGYTSSTSAMLSSFATPATCPPGCTSCAMTVGVSPSVGLSDPAMAAGAASSQSDMVPNVLAPVDQRLFAVAPIERADATAPPPSSNAGPAVAASPACS